MSDDHYYTLGERKILEELRALRADLQHDTENILMADTELQTHLESLIQADEAAVEAVGARVAEVQASLEAAIKAAEGDSLNAAPLEAGLAKVKELAESIDAAKTEPTEPTEPPTEPTEPPNEG